MMKTIRFPLVFAVLLIAGAIGVIQQVELSRLKKAERDLAVKYRNLSALYAELLATVDGKGAETAPLSDEHAEILKLRNQLSQAKADQQKLTAVQTENDALKNELLNGLSGYMTQDQLKFVGFNSPENALQSFKWAQSQSNYSNWVASLTPERQAEVLADPQSRKDFEAEKHPSSRMKGMQILARKPIGNDRVELKTRLDYESGVVVLVFPMVAVGNEWKLGEDIHSYTEIWDK